MNKIFFLFIILSFSCEKNVTPLKKSNKTVSNETINIKKKESNSSNIYIDLLDEFYTFNGYYIPLFYKNKYSKNTEEKILSVDTKLIEETNECSRIKINNVTANTHLNTSHLGKITVFDANQNKIKELTLNNFEYYSDAISSCFIASYPKANTNNSQLKEKLIISSNYKDSFEFKKTPTPKKNIIILKTIVNKLNFKIDYLHKHASFINKKDTISFLSFSEYSQRKNCTYLIKNNKVTDSIINDYIISDLTPVPLAHKKELLYVASCHIPDSDIFWTSLLGINIKENKFHFYEGNRLSTP